MIVKNTELSQKFGVLAIGETVCREFGFDGIFYGTINAFRREDDADLYTVRYTDGDQEDMDLEEYNFAYALWLQQEGWDIDEDDGIEDDGSEGKEEDYCDEVPLVEEVKLIKKSSAARKTKAKLEEVINGTCKKSVAGKHIAIMSAAEKDDVVTKLTKTAKTNENKLVKATVLGVTYNNRCTVAFLQHLQNLQGPVSNMVHARRKTLAEEQGLLAQIKVGDWVEVEPDYSPSICSDGGIGCVLGLHREECAVPGSVVACTITAVDVHYLVFNRKERRVLVSRAIVIPMPYKADKPNLRARKNSCSSTKVVAHKAPPQKTSLEWLQYGLETRRHETPGWLLKLLEEHNILPTDNKVAKWARIMTDYNCQLAYLQGLQHALGAAYKDPRDYTGIRATDSGGKYVSLKKSSQQGVPKNMYTIPYLMWAYDVNKCTFKRKLKESKQSYTAVTTIKKHTGTSVIDCRDMARERYNAKHFYCHHQALTSREPTEDDMITRPLWHKYKHRVAYWGIKFDQLVAEGGDVSMYTRMAREHD